jgi:hypothetical protein
MKLAIEFLKGIGHTDKVYIRCLPPKNTPQPELEARGMTYQDKSGVVKKSVINGFIDLQTGVFSRRYGDKYKPVSDGWSCIQTLNKQGYGVYFVVGHGGERNAEISHGSVLFHESDRASLKQQQLEIDRITQEFGKPTAVVQTKKSLHGYWASEIIRIDNLATYQRRWLQYSNCDDLSLDDPSQLMRLPGFDHLAWNPETQDLDRVQCELLQLNEVSYALDEFDRVLPALDIDRWCQQSISDLIESDADDRDIRSLAPYLPGFDSSRKWKKAKCPAHDGESSDSLHIDSETGGFICHAGCSSSAVYNATKAVAVAAGHRFEVADKDEYLKESISKALDLKNCEAPILFGGDLGRLLKETASNFNERVEIFNFISIPVLASRIPSETCLIVNMGFAVKPVRWCGLVGGTGTMKSPILNTVIKPLNAEQIEIWKNYLAAVEVYEKESEEFNKLSKDEKKANDEPKHPKNMQSLYFSDFTIESLIAGISDYPDEGAIVYSDELAGFFSSMDAYKSSAGVDRPKWLSIWDGGAIKCNRRSGSSYVPHSSISIIGGIQPGIIESLIKKDKSKADGLWSRFTFMRIEHKLVSLFTSTEGSLGETLTEIYKRLASEPSQQHTIDVNARPLCTAWHEFLHQKMTDEGENNPLMVGIYAKTIGITFRNALILHRVYAAIDGDKPKQEIPLETIETAIAWTKFEINQTLMEYQMLGLNDDNDPELARILKFISKFGGDSWLSKNPEGWVSPRDVIQWWFPKTTRNNGNIRKFMNKVVDLGHAVTNDESADSTKFKIKLLHGKSANKANKVAETEIYQGLPLLSPKPTKLAAETPQSSHISMLANMPTKDNNPPTSANKNSQDSNDGGVEAKNVGFVGLNVGNVGTLANTLVNIASDDIGAKNVGLETTGVNSIPINSSGNNVGFVGSISENNLKIGDRVKLGEDIITIEKIEKDFIGGKSDDGSYIGGDRNSVELVSVDEFPVTQETTQFKTIDDGGIEYEC